MSGKSRSLRDEFQNTVLAEHLPVSLLVHFATQAGLCQTLEGPVAYQPGDALVTGLQGEQWPIQRQRLLENYVPTGSNVAGDDGRYQHLPQRVMACRLSAPVEVTLSDGRGVLHGAPGDWLIEHKTGGRAIVAAAIFDTTYRIVGSDQ